MELARLLLDTALVTVSIIGTIKAWPKPCDCKKRKRLAKRNRAQRLNRGY